MSTTTTLKSGSQSWGICHTYCVHAQAMATTNFVSHPGADKLWRKASQLHLTQAFPYRTITGTSAFYCTQAFLLAKARVLRPRYGRGLDAPFPRSRAASCPYPWPGRDRVLSGTSPHPRDAHDHAQCVAISWPCPHPRPHSVPVRVRVVNVRALLTTANDLCPFPVRDRVQATVSPCPHHDHDHAQCVAISRPCPHPRSHSVPVRVPVANVRALSATANDLCPFPVRDHVEPGKCPGFGRIVSVLCPFHCQPLSTYARL